MSAPLARLRSVFVAPRPATMDATRHVARVVASPRLAVLCSRSEALPAGVALSLGLVRETGASVGAVCVWTGSEAWRAPGGWPLAHPSARRLTARLAARELRASAAGRLAHVALPADPHDAVTAAARAGATTAGPMVLVLCGPRDDIVDQALALQDLIVVGRARAADAALLRLVEAGLLGLGVPTVECELASSSLDRALARSGLSVPGGLRRALSPAISAAS